MEYIFLTVLAALLLFPVLFMIRAKLGLSRVGILAAAGLSCAFVVLVLITQSIMPVWQAVLLTLLLALSVSYLIQQKLAYVLFTEKEEADLEENDLVIAGDAMLIEDLENYTYAQFMEKYNPSNGDKIEHLFERKEEETEEVHDTVANAELSYLEELFQHDYERKKDGTEL